MSSKTKQSYEFEGYRLDGAPAGLWRNDELISLPPKVLEMLILLVEKKGEIVTLEELLNTVWPDTHVEEGNIKYTISLLRKSLGKELIQTIPRRGYRFVAKVSEAAANGKETLASDAASTSGTSADVPIEQIEEVTTSKSSPRKVLVVASLLLIVSATVLGIWWKLSK